MRYLGIDWSRKTSTFNVGDASGKRLARGEVCNDVGEFRQLVRKWRDEEGIRVVIEVGGRTFKWSRAMQEEGADVFIVETHQNALIRESTRKTDHRDALQLREQGRLNMLPPDGVPVPSEQEEELRLLLKARANAVAERTAISNKAVRIADYYGFYMARSACTTDKGWRLLLGKSLEWSELHQLLLKQLYERYCLNRQHLALLEEEFERHCQTPALERKATLLRSVPGIGPVTTWAILARIADVHRFPNARKLVRYCGLAPSQRQSGNYHGGGRLSKNGNALLRGYLTQAAVGVITSKDTTNPLRLWYEEVKKRRGWKKARVALARKLLTVAYGVLKYERPFDPELLRQEERKDKQAA